MGTRFENLIIMGVITGAIALASCSDSTQDEDSSEQPPPQQQGQVPPVLVSAVAYVGSEVIVPFLRGGNSRTLVGDPIANTVVLTFSKPVIVKDLEAAASGFMLTENVGKFTSYTTRSCTSCTPKTYTDHVAPYYACNSVTSTGTLRGQCDFTSLTLGRPSSLKVLTSITPVLATSPLHSDRLFLDYRNNGGLDIRYSHGTGYLRLRYTDSELHPIQDLQGDALESFTLPGHEDVGNVLVSDLSAAP